MFVLELGSHTSRIWSLSVLEVTGIKKGWNETTPCRLFELLRTSCLLETGKLLRYCYCPRCHLSRYCIRHRRVSIARVVCDGLQERPLGSVSVTRRRRRGRNWPKTPKPSMPPTSRPSPPNPSQPRLRPNPRRPRQKRARPNPNPRQSQRRECAPPSPSRKLLRRRRKPANPAKASPQSPASRPGPKSPAPKSSRKPSKRSSKRSRFVRHVTIN